MTEETALELTYCTGRNLGKRGREVRRRWNLGTRATKTMPGQRQGQQIRRSLF